MEFMVLPLGNLITVNITMEHYQYVDDLPIQNKAAGSPGTKIKNLVMFRGYVRLQLQCLNHHKILWYPLVSLLSISYPIMQPILMMNHHVWSLNPNVLLMNHHVWSFYTHLWFIIISVGELTIFDGETLQLYSIETSTFRWFQPGSAMWWQPGSVISWGGRG